MVPSETKAGYPEKMMREVFDRIKTEMDPLGVYITDGQIEQMAVFFEMLVEKNRVMNLTAITDPEEAVMRHFLDSLMLVRLIDPDDTDSLIDVGTGAGFPGIPLKIVFPNIKTVLLDSLDKRIRFLDDVITMLGLTDTEAVHARAEDAGRDPLLREQFDLAVSRAVSSLPVLTEYCMPFVRIGGSFVSYKSDQVEEEVNTAKKAVHLTGGKIVKTDCFRLPGSDIGRSLIRIDKIRSTPSVYPRKAGIPSKKPL